MKVLTNVVETFAEKNCLKQSSFFLLLLFNPLKCEQYTVQSNELNIFEYNERKVANVEVNSIGEVRFEADRKEKQRDKDKYGT